MEIRGYIKRGVRMNIGNIVSNNFNLDSNGKDMQIEVYEQLIEQLQQENKHLDEVNCHLRKNNEQLKENWNKLRECLKDVMNSSNDDDKEFVETILDIMQELEQGSGSNENN